MKNELIFVLFVVLIFSCLVGSVSLFERQTCYAKAGDMGFEYRFLIIGGCQIEVEEGRWIPLESYYFKEE